MKRSLGSRELGIFQNCKQNKLLFMKAKDGMFVKENKNGRKRGETVEGNRVSVDQNMVQTRVIMSQGRPFRCTLTTS